MSIRTFNIGVMAGSQSRNTSPSSITLQNWWRPEGLNLAATYWTDEGSEGADLTAGFANPAAESIPIDGNTSISGVGLSSLKNISTSMSGAREVWVVVRPDDLSTQLVLDGSAGTNRQTLFVGASGAISANAGTTLATAGGTAPEHRAQILRVVVSGDGTGSIYRVTDTGASLTSPLITGTIGSGLWDGITLGAANTGSSAWKGAISEVLRYSSALAVDDSTTTAGYLLSKYPSAAKITLSTTNLLCLGDSLTSGAPSESGYSYKENLFYAFEGNDISSTTTLVFNGTNNQQVFDHDGVSGNTIAQIEARAAAAIAANSPDVLVLIAGTNDCQDALYDGPTAEASYASLLSAIHTADASLPVVLCLVPPLTTVSHNNNATDLNSRLISTVIPSALSTIHTVDVRSEGFTSAAGFTIDGTHFNAAGESTAAIAIEAGIRSAFA